MTVISSSSNTINNDAFRHLSDSNVNAVSDNKLLELFKEATRSEFTELVYNNDGSYRSPKLLQRLVKAVEAKNGKKGYSLLIDKLKAFRFGAYNIRYVSTIKDVESSSSKILSLLNKAPNKLSFLLMERLIETIGSNLQGFESLSKTSIFADRYVVLLALKHGKLKQLYDFVKDKDGFMEVVMLVVNTFDNKISKNKIINNKNSHNWVYDDVVAAACVAIRDTDTDTLVKLLPFISQGKLSSLCASLLGCGRKGFNTYHSKMYQGADLVKILKALVTRGAMMTDSLGSVPGRVSLRTDSARHYDRDREYFPIDKCDSEAHEHISIQNIMGATENQQVTNSGKPSEAYEYIFNQMVHECTENPKIMDKFNSAEYDDVEWAQELRNKLQNQ